MMIVLFFFSLMILDFMLQFLSETCDRDVSHVKFVLQRKLENFLLSHLIPTPVQILPLDYLRMVFLPSKNFIFPSKNLER